MRGPKSAYKAARAETEPRGPGPEGPPQKQAGRKRPDGPERRQGTSSARDIKGKKGKSKHDNTPCPSRDAEGMVR